MAIRRHGLHRAEPGEARSPEEPLRRETSEQLTLL
jgi:hypothetical protein